MYLLQVQEPGPLKKAKCFFEETFSVSHRFIIFDEFHINFSNRRQGLTLNQVHQAITTIAMLFSPLQTILKTLQGFSNPPETLS